MSSPSPTYIEQMYLGPSPASVAVPVVACDSPSLCLPGSGRQTQEEIGPANPKIGRTEPILHIVMFLVVVLLAPPGQRLLEQRVTGERQETGTGV